MNKKNKWTERMKSALIVLLLISAVYLGAVSGLFGGLIDDDALDGIIASLFHRGVVDDHSDDSVKSEAARPLSIVITNETGGHFGAKYDGDVVDTVYIRTRDTFREALGSADLPSVTDQSAWQSALQEPNVYFEYLTPVRLSMLGEWYGTSVQSDWGDTMVRRLCVTIDENGNKLYYQDETTGSFYAASTAALGSISDLTESYGENSAVFIFEVPGLVSSKNPYMMLQPDTTSHPVLEAKNPLLNEQSQEEALAAIGVSEHIIESFTDPNGTIVSVGEDADREFTLRQTKEGTLIYTLKDRKTELPAMSEGEAVEAARKMVADTIGRHCGNARVYLASITPSGSGSYSMTFQYVVAGGQIYLFDNGYAAQVTIEDGAIKYMVLNFREYKITGEPLQMMHEIQAAAASGGEFILNYSDQGGDKVKPEWVELPL